MVDSGTSFTYLADPMYTELVQSVRCVWLSMSSKHIPVDVFYVVPPNILSFVTVQFTSTGSIKQSQSKYPFRILLRCQVIFMNQNNSKTRKCSMMLPNAIPVCCSPNQDAIVTPNISFTTSGGGIFPANDPIILFTDRVRARYIVCFGSKFLRNLPFLFFVVCRRVSSCIVWLWTGATGWI